MITEFNTEEVKFKEILNDLYHQSLKDSLLSKMRAQAFEAFKNRGLPSKKDEHYRYVSLRKVFADKYKKPSFQEIDQESIRKYFIEECLESTIVLVNGVYSKELSSTGRIPSKIVFSSIDEASKTYYSFLNNQLIKGLKDEKDPFVLFNAAMIAEGLFIYIPPKTVFGRPIQILNLIDSKESSVVINSRLQVFAGAFSEAEFVLTTKVISGHDHFINHVSEFAIDEEAKVRFNQPFNEIDQSICYFDATRASLKKHSSFDAFMVTNGSQTIRTDYKVSLQGENAESALYGLSMLEGTNEFHSHVLMEHEAPNCRSRQLFKNVLDDSSRSSFEGKILVRKEAQKTDAFQLNNHLLLNDFANAYSKPNLEIFADDVKASHGSTFGQLNQEQLFCLKSRGIQSYDAKNLLIFSFCKEVIELFKIDSLQRDLTNQAKRYKTAS